MTLSHPAQPSFLKNNLMLGIPSAVLLLFAIIIFLMGVLGAQVLQGVGSPSSATLSASLVVALIVAAIIVFLPQVVAGIPGNAISHRGLVLAGAILGYWIKR